MRPLELTFAGLRSYVEPQTIDFTGKTFIAILGDTGSGKSTVLDAMCYGLYNRCSWYGGSVSDLIAHSGDGTLRVAFTFRADNTTWRVERSTGAHGAAVHRLTDLDADAVVATGAGAVTAQVRRIIGLDYDTFLRSVILPQGRFQELLRMRDRDRTGILKSLLGLDQLGTVREHALTLHSRLVRRLGEYRERRATFLPDPAATIREATELQRAAHERLGLLQAAQHAVAKAAEAASTARVRRACLDEARTRLTDATPANVTAKYQVLVAAASDIAIRREQVDRERHTLDQEARRLQAELDHADAEDTGVEKTASAVSTLNHLAEQVPQLDAQAERLEKEQSEVRIRKAMLDGSRKEVTNRKEAAANAKQALDGAAGRVSKAEEELRVATSALAAFRQATDAAHQAEENLTACRDDVAELKVLVERASAETREAEHAVEAAEAEDARARRLHAAAVAADGCRTGDPCPVCQRELPEDFAAPSNDATRAASTALKAAQKAARRAATKEASATERAQIAENQTLAAAINEVETTTITLDQALLDVRAVLGDVDLNAPVEQLLHHNSTAVQSAAIEHTAAKIAHGEAHDEYTRADSQLPVLENEQARRQAVYEEARADLEATVVRLNRAARAVPRAFRPIHGLQLTDITHQRHRAQQRQGELKQICDGLSDARSRLAELQIASGALDTEINAHITRPATDLRRQLDTLADRVADAGILLDTARHALRLTDISLVDEAAWAASLVERTAELIATAREQAEAALAAVDEAEQAAKQARLGCQADDDEHLERLVRAASTSEHNASHDLKRATAHQPLAAELDHRIQAAEPTVTALGDLAALLTDGKFIANAVRQRQLALLGAASKTLLAISGGKFGFAENFRIIDTGIGRARDVKTLSGGETFQASLALALAVVELASRASGRVDSLFLDEGFGSLDSSVLQDALNALAAHSTAGRLVTIISHMRSIAEITDHVLVVERTFRGSQAHWADPEEREQIVNDDLNRGLLS
ncbi:AAA family ATPase [Virgisporangium aurantiacum]|uniref:Nuclease SbcCD subunit C n=1 Tax=Virgisporangium aurantiacum TaxID=175570 RepID=A0A8J3ZMF4_9ACTN|nr:SMC family ATPase [Virgisporangium aurantiacum]GIJ64650.1 nuclease SbcCD subunit C [Virgisporangium aurantiacum]